MQITTAQFDAFRIDAMQDFEHRALSYLREEHPAYGLENGEAGLRQVLGQSQLQALMVELGTERGIVIWAELLIVYGPRFLEEEPWARYIATADLEPAEKIDRLRQYL